MPKPLCSVAEGRLQVCSTKIQIQTFREPPDLAHMPK